MPPQWPMRHQTIFVADIAGYTGPARTMVHQRVLRDGLHQVLTGAFAESGVDLSTCYIEERGDGAVILVPAEVVPIRLTDELPSRLVAGLRRHNAVHSAAAAIQLRVALHAGQVGRDEYGVVGEELNFAFRILDASEMKSALRSTTSVLGLIASNSFYHDVIVNDPAGHPDCYRMIPVWGEETSTVAWLRLPDYGGIADRPWADSSLPTLATTSTGRVVSSMAVHRTIVVVDVEGFGDQRRTTPHQLAVRESLYRLLRSAFDSAGVPWDDCDHEDRGDGVLILVGAHIPKAMFVASVPRALAAMLCEHNATHPAQQRIRLRMAVHAGEVAYDRHGVTAVSVNLAFRLLDAKPVKDVLAESSGVLAVITSEWFFEEVVRHSVDVDPATYRPVQVVVKETATVGWICLPDYPYPADPNVLVRGRSRQLPPDVALLTGGVAAVETDHIAAGMITIDQRHYAQLDYVCSASVSWPVRVGPIPLLADSYQARAEGAILDHAVSRAGTAVRTQVVTGLGGVGKTQLAAAYARARLPQTDLVLWVSATSREAIVAAYAQAAAELGHRSPVGAADEAAGWLRSWFQNTNRSWLVVLDDLADPADVAGFWPDGPTGSTIVTTRRTDAALFGGGRRRVEVGLFTPDEARDYLAAKLGLDAGSETFREADRLARDVGFLPLALAQAATFMLDRRETCAGYRAW